jgi:hypothetical protein
VEVRVTVSLAVRSWLVIVAALPLLPGAPGHIAWAQGARDSARADSMRRSPRTGLVPAGFGSLHQADIAITATNLGLTVSAIPLDESVIRTLAPDSYRTMRALRENKSRQLEAVRSRMGLPSVEAWYVTFFNVQQGEAPFDPGDFVVRSAGQDFRALDVFPISTGFGDGRVRQNEKKSAIYAFDPQVDLTQPIVVTTLGQQVTTWGDNLPRIEQERSLIWSRASATGEAPKKP